MRRVLLLFFVTGAVGWSDDNPAPPDGPCEAVASPVAVRPAPADAGKPPSFDWHARLHYYLRRTYSPERMALLGLDTGIDHLAGDPEEWSRAPDAFGRRYAASFARRVVRNTIELGAGAVLREDARLLPSGKKGFRRRLRHALRGALLTSDGRRFAFSRAVATAGGVAISASWYPGPLTGRTFAEGFVWGYLGHLQNSVLTEFEADFKKTGRRIWRRLAPDRPED